MRVSLVLGGRAALACSMVNTCDNTMIMIGVCTAHVIQVCYTCESARLWKRSISTETLNQNPILTAGIYYALWTMHTQSQDLKAPFQYR